MEATRLLAVVKSKLGRTADALALLESFQQLFHLP
jgi:hypothetical protein